MADPTAIVSVVDNGDGTLSLIPGRATVTPGAGYLTIDDDLQDWQLELDGVRVGPGTGYMLQAWDDGGIPDRVTQDAPMPGEDGQRFGVDAIGGRTFSATIASQPGDPGSAFDAADALVSAWLGDGVRRTPGVVQTLRIRRPGRPTVCLFGRPRRATPAYDSAFAGYIPIVADFACSDHRFYSDGERKVTVPIVTSSPGGWSWPLSWPARLSSPVSTVVTVGTFGGLSTWLTTTFYGPVSAPMVEFLDSSGGVLWKVSMPALTLASDQSVTVDPRPWARTALRSDGANLAGKLSRDTARMENMLVPPGTWQVRFTGTDQTGTATCGLALRDAYASL